MSLKLSRLHAFQLLRTSDCPTPTLQTTFVFLSALSRAGSKSGFETSATKLL